MNAQQCGEYYMKTGKIPPVNLITWVAVYNILTSANVI